jgi:hypothetical protein
MDKNIEMIRKLADLLSLDEARAFNVIDLARRFANTEEQYRYDQVIRNVGGVVEKIARHTPNHSLSPKQVFDLYNRFAALNPNTKFKEAFGDLLPQSEQIKRGENPMDRKRQDYNSPERDLTTAKQAAIEIDELEAALEHPVETIAPGIEKFDPSLLKNQTLHDPKLVGAGNMLVITQLQTLGLGNIRAELKYGVKSCLLYLASFPTAKGRVFINIPLSVENNIPQVPSVFADLTGKRLYAFSREGVAKLLNETDTIREELHLEAANAKRHNMSTGHRELNAGAKAIEVDEVETYVSEISPPKLSKLNPELADVEAILANAVLRKTSKYTDGLINTGRSLVAQEFAKHGYKYSDVRFAGDADFGILFDAVLQTRKGKLELTVPIEVANGIPLFPTRFAADDGEVHQLNCDELEVIIGAEGAVEPVRYSAALVGMDYNSLRKVVHKATFDRKHSIVKEALNLIHDQFGTDAYNTAVTDYQDWLEQASQDFSHRCTGCQYYRPRNSRYATSSVDHCNLLHTKCGNVVRKSGICSRSHIEWDKQHDDHYKGTIMTSSINLT